MQNVSLRQVIAADQPFLREMLYESLYVPAGHEPFSRTILEHLDIAKYVEQWGRDGDLALLAVQDSVDVGAAWLWLLRNGQRGYGYVDDKTPELSVALLPAYRRQGLGTALLTRLLEQAALRYKAVSLSVSNENPAKRLYERLGFIKVSEDHTSAIVLRRLS